MSIEYEFVSVISPCRNEINYIEQFLNNLVHQDYPKDKLQVLVVDGMSNDGTRDIIKKYTNKYPWIKLIDNPNYTAPFALNLGIRNSKGLVLRMDTHSSYPPNYISQLLFWMKKLDADNVGCAVETIPTNLSKKAVAIANVLAHPFGVGNAYFRLGVEEAKEVDTVMFGFYRREVFDKIGYFDEELTRNQDDEFNARLKKSGGKIYLVPGIKFKYYPRDTFAKLWKMYYQYGYFKPLVNKKIGRPSNIRQLIPPLFILGLGVGILCAIFFSKCLYLLLGLISIYAVSNIIFSIFLSFSSHILTIFYNVIGFSILHFAYGFGYIKGIVDFILLKKSMKNKTERVTISR